MTVSIVTFANLGRKQNLKTPDIIPVLEKFQKEGQLIQVICQLSEGAPYPYTVSAVPKLVRYLLGALRRIRVPLPRRIEEKLFDFFAAQKLVSADLILFHGGYFLPRTMRCAKAQGAMIVDLAVSAHPKTNALLEREELERLGFPNFEAGYMQVEKESPHLHDFDYVIGMSQFVKETYTTAGFPEERIFVAAPDIDLKRFTPCQSPRTSFEILYMAHTQPLKGLHYLLDAWEMARLERATLTVVGGFASMPRALKERYLARMRSLAVTYIPGTNTPERYFRAASVLVFPSLTEGFGRVTLEAMACGIPVITTEHARGLIENERTGFVVPIRDSEVLAEKIAYLAKHPEVVSRMGREARQAVERKVSFGETVYAITQEILSRSGRATLSRNV